MFASVLWGVFIDFIYKKLYISTFKQEENLARELSVQKGYTSQNSPIYNVWQRWMTPVLWWIKAKKKAVFYLQTNPKTKQKYHKIKSRLETTLVSKKSTKVKSWNHSGFMKTDLFSKYNVKSQFSSLHYCIIKSLAMVRRFFLPKVRAFICRKKRDRRGILKNLLRNLSGYNPVFLVGFYQDYKRKSGFFRNDKNPEKKSRVPIRIPKKAPLICLGILNLVVLDS